MIPVAINGTPVYKVCFGRTEYSKLKNGQPLYETEAKVYVIDARREDVPVASAKARQWHKDRYSPELARRAALRMLLDNRVRQAHGLDETTFMRVEREAIWKAYFNRPRHQSKKEMPTPPAAPTVPARVAAPTVRPDVVAQRPLNASGNTHPIVNNVVNIGRPWFSKGNPALTH